MKYILIILISIFSLNYSFCQDGIKHREVNMGHMKVYAGTDKYNSSLVGTITREGEVYKYKNGEHVLYGIVRDHRFFAYDQKNYSEIQVGSYSRFGTMRVGGKIYIDVGEGIDRVMIAFRDEGNYYSADDILDKSHKMGFHVNDFLYGLDGRYAAAYYLIFDRK